VRDLEDVALVVGAAARGGAEEVALGVQGDAPLGVLSVGAVEGGNRGNGPGALSHLENRSIVVDAADHLVLDGAEDVAGGVNGDIVGELAVGAVE
jgi:hypothetical protein